MDIINGTIVAKIEALEPHRVMVMLQRLFALVEARFVVILKIVHAHDPEVAHRELRRATLDAAEEQVQQVTHGIDAPLQHERGPGHGIHERLWRHLLADQPHEFRLAKTGGRPRHLAADTAPDLSAGQHAEQLVEMRRRRCLRKTRGPDRIQQRLDGPEFGIAEFASDEDAALAVDHAHVQALCVTAQGAERVDKCQVRIAQHVPVVREHKVEHLREMRMVIKGRQFARAGVFRLGSLIHTVRVCY